MSWRTVDDRNNKMYIEFLMGAELLETTLTFDSRNYDGYTFAIALAAKLNTAIVGAAIVVLFVCVYDLTENRLTISIVDTRASKTLPFFLRVLADDELKEKTRTLTP